MSDLKKIAFRDWRKTEATTSLRCSLCGCVVEHRGYLTKDHVLPSKLCKEGAAGFGTQLLCRRCNSIKAALPPTVWVYKLVCAVRLLELEADYLHLNSIRPNQTFSSVYKVVFEGKVGFYSKASSNKILLFTPRDKSDFWSEGRVDLLQKVLSDKLFDNTLSIDFNLLLGK